MLMTRNGFIWKGNIFYYHQLRGAFQKSIGVTWNFRTIIWNGSISAGNFFVVAAFIFAHARPPARASVIPAIRQAIEISYFKIERMDSEGIRHYLATRFLWAPVAAWRKSARESWLHIAKSSSKETGRTRRRLAVCIFWWRQASAV